MHVGGRNNAAGYVEFGSIQAVEALVRQVIRDLPQPAKREPLTDEEMGKIINANWGVGVWEMARAIERAHGITKE